MKMITQIISRRLFILLIYNYTIPNANETVKISVEPFKKIRHNCAGHSQITVYVTTKDQEEPPKNGH